MKQQKLLFLAFLNLAIPFITNAQETPESGPVQEGTIRYMVTHNWTKKLNALTYLSKQRKERANYMYGNDAEWSEYTLLHFSPTQTHYLDSEERVNSDDQGYSWRRETFWIRRNFEQNTMHDALTLQGKTYQIQDSIRCQDWKILNDMKEVAGHLCMNASWEDTLKQQKIVAWFALDIPHSGGPERLCGLPGLILEMDVNDGAMIVTANRIEAKKLSKEFDLPKKIKGKKSTELEYQKALYKLIQESIKEEQPYFWLIRY
ncbi:MAG: GLPGLI family protein [Saprospiraceae bacterium]|nr:GLPGLI family protein [Saprospiraceae bacterium]